MTVAEFREALLRDNIPMQKFREELRSEIVISRLRDREVDNRITISENEVDLFLAEQAAGTDAASEYQLSHIVIRLPEQASPEQTERQRARAEEVVKRTRAGVDFAQLSAAYSDAPEAMTGGDMGWRERDRMPDLYLEAVSKMRPGEVSEVLRSPAGFHALKLIGKRGGGASGAGAAPMVNQTNARHILIKTNEVVSEDEAKRKLVNIRERIVAGANFAEVAKLNSEDGSASKGGDLGWLYSGDTVAEFERAMDELPLNQVSQPVRSQFGWHLIEVLERRKADMSTERKRAEARRVLRDRKADESYQEWVRQLRDRAYVEYRLEDK